MDRAGDPPRPRTSGASSLLLLGAGELGKELAIAAQGMGLRVIAADRYDGAPAMQVAHAAEVLSLLDGTALEGVIRTHRPDLILPELESVRVETLAELEAEGFRVVPNAAAAGLLADRGTLREWVAGELGLRAPRFARAASPGELHEVCDRIGYPVVIKPRSSSSGRGQSVVTGAPRLDHAWEAAVQESDGSARGVLAEEFIEFETEVTVLAVREEDGTLHFLPPIGHRQGRGGYRESWTPQPVGEADGVAMRSMATRILDRIGGAGLFGLEFFLTDTGPAFSELSLGPHDTGLVTLVSHELSQFDLHLRAILGWPIPEPRSLGPAASAVILADREGTVAGYGGVGRALEVERTDIRIFGKPEGRPFRRMGVALSTGETVEEARARALEAAARVEILYR